MGALSTAFDNAALDAILGSGHAAGFPSPVFVGLSTTAPAKDGTNVTEPANTYARVSVTNNSTNWPNASAAAKANGTVITFPTPTASWGTVGWWVMYDASTAGNLIAYGALSAPSTLGSGVPPNFPVGALILGAD